MVVKADLAAQVVAVSQVAAASAVAVWEAAAAAVGRHLPLPYDIIQNKTGEKIWEAVS